MFNFKYAVIHLGASLVSYFQRATHTPRINFNAPMGFPVALNTYP